MENHLYYSSVPAMLRVKSPCYMRANVLASDAWKAIDKAYAHHVPLVQAALSLRQANIPYHIQLIAAENGVHAEMAHGVGQFAFFEDVPMDAHDVVRVEENAKVLTLNPKARHASFLLARGLSLSGMGTDPALTAAALLAYHQVLEAVASAVPWTPPTDRQQQQTK